MDIYESTIQPQKNPAVRITKRSTKPWFLGWGNDLLVAIALQNSPETPSPTARKNNYIETVPGIAGFDIASPSMACQSLQVFVDRRGGSCCWKYGAYWLS